MRVIQFIKDIKEIYSFNYSVDEEKEYLAYDIYYIKHRNIVWDIAMLVKAVFWALGGRHK